MPHHHRPQFDHHFRPPGPGYAHPHRPDFHEQPLYHQHHGVRPAFEFRPRFAQEPYHHYPQHHMVRPKLDSYSDSYSSSSSYRSPKVSLRPSKAAGDQQKKQEVEDRMADLKQRLMQQKKHAEDVRARSRNREVPLSSSRLVATGSKEVPLSSSRLVEAPRRSRSRKASRYPSYREVHGEDSPRPSGGRWRPTNNMWDAADVQIVPMDLQDIRRGRARSGDRVLRTAVVLPPRR